MQLVKFTSIFFLTLILLACAEGPSEQKQIASKGLLSGDISVEGDNAVIGSIFNGGSYWDLKKNERLFDWNHAKGKMSLIRAAAISGNGLRAVTCVENNMVLWDTQSGKYLQFWQASSRIESVSINLDGSRALMGLKDGTASYFDMDKGAEIFNFTHQAEVRSTGLSEDGLIGITGSDDNTAKILDLKNGKVINSQKLHNQIKTVAISPSGDLAFATAQREDALIWDTKTGETIFKFSNTYTNYTVANFSKDEKYLSLGTFQGAIILYDLKSKKKVNTWQAKPRKAFGGASSKAIIDLVYSGKIITALTSDGMVEIFKAPQL